MTPGHYRRSWPADPAMLAIARIAIRDQLRVAGIADEEWLAEVTLAVSEACADAAARAREGTSGRGKFTVEMGAGADGDVAVRVRDNGQRAGPEVEDPSAGARLSMMTSLARSVTIQSREDGPGTDVWMKFALQRPAEAPS